MANNRETPSETPTMMPGKNGGTLKVGNPGNKGGGRTPDEFKRRMARIASSKKALEYLRECVEGKHGPKAAVAAHKHVTERGYGKEVQPLSGPDGGPIEHVVTRKVVHAQPNRVAEHVNGANGNGRP